MKAVDCKRLSFATAQEAIACRPSNYNENRCGEVARKEERGGRDQGFARGTIELKGVEYETTKNTQLEGSLGKTSTLPEQSFTF